MSLLDIFTRAKKHEMLANVAYAALQDKLDKGDYKNVKSAALYAAAIIPMIEYQLKHPENFENLMSLVDILDEVLPTKDRETYATTLLLTLNPIEDMWRKHLPKIAGKEFMSIYESITNTLSEVVVDVYAACNTPEEKHAWIQWLIDLDPQQTLPRPRQDNACLNVIKMIYNRHREDIPADTMPMVTDYIRAYYPKASPPAAPQATM